MDSVSPRLRALKRGRAVRGCLMGSFLQLASCSAQLIQASQQDGDRSECVVLLHGLGRSAWSMKALEWQLRGQGYHLVNVNYPSWDESIESLAIQAVGEGVVQCRQIGCSRVHFVTHSLGGILLRQYLAKKSLPELGRVVMLGPPNGGSSLTEGLITQSWFPSWAPPAVRQLGTRDHSVPKQLGPVVGEVGVLAGTRNRRPLLMSFMNSRQESPSDGTVLVAETRVAGMKDFRTLPVTHTFMMWDSQVIVEVIHFLKTGRFSAR